MTRIREEEEVAQSKGDAQATLILARQMVYAMALNLAWQRGDELVCMGCGLGEIRCQAMLRISKCSRHGTHCYSIVVPSLLLV